MNPSFARRLCMIVLLSLVSILLHELGHYSVYKVAKIPVRITFQSVSPVTPISGPVALLGVAAGPACSLFVALACLLIGRYRPGFFWPTAGFTNATLRLFPCTIEFLRLFRGAMPFSDEDAFALAVTHSTVSRACLILFFFAVAAILTVLAARQYCFQRYATLKVIGIYVLSLGTGVGVIILDELLHPMRM